MAKLKKIGVLTSGGDCPGLNAVIRGVTLRADESYGCEVTGIHDGHLGLLKDPPDVEVLTPGHFSGELLRTGGTFLGTTTTVSPFAYPMEDGTKKDRSAEVIATIESLGLDGIIVIGGDGSMRLFDRLLTSAGVPWVGIPKTIDNDVPGTEFAVGFFTAVDVVGNALDRLQSTAASHRRTMVLETMGRESGFIALYGGVTGGADAVLIPELEYDLEALADHVTRIRAEEKGHVLVTVAEGVPGPGGEPVTLPYYGSHAAAGGVGTVLADALSEKTGVSARCTVLGHLQRGGIPAMFDRLLGSVLSAQAVDVLMRGGSARMAAWRNGGADDVPMDEVVKGPRKVDLSGGMISVARGLGMYVGTN